MAAKPTEPPKGPSKPAGPQPLSLEVDLDSLTIDDLAFIEEKLDVGIEQLGDLANLKGVSRLRVLQAIAFIHMRRSDPDLTFEDVGQLKLSELNMGTPPSGEGSGADE